MSNDYQMKLCVHVVLFYLSVSKSAKIRIISIFIWIIFINHNLQAERHEYLYGLSQSLPKKQGGGRSERGLVRKIVRALIFRSSPLERATNSCEIRENPAICTSRSAYNREPTSYINHLQLTPQN